MYLNLFIVHIINKKKSKNKSLHFAFSCLFFKLITFKIMVVVLDSKIVHLM